MCATPRRVDTVHRRSRHTTPYAYLPPEVAPTDKMAAAGTRLLSGGKAWAAGAAVMAVVIPGVAFADKDTTTGGKGKERAPRDDSGRPLFDPEALERGAAALREINKSPYAKQASRATSWVVGP